MRKTVLALFSVALLTLASCSGGSVYIPFVSSGNTHHLTFTVVAVDEVPDDQIMQNTIYEEIDSLRSVKVVTVGKTFDAPRAIFVPVKEVRIIYENASVTRAELERLSAELVTEAGYRVFEDPSDVKLH
jgi:hypothetical protein